MTISSDRRFAPAASLSWTDAGTELVLFDRDRGSYHALNASGSAIWRVLGEGRSEAEAVDLLAARFGADPALIAVDVAEFIDGALADGLITTA